MTAYDVIAFDMDGVILTRGHGHWEPNAFSAAEHALQSVGVTADAERYDEFRDAVASLYFEDVDAVYDDVRTHAEFYDVDADTVWNRTEESSVKIQQRQLQDPQDGRGLHADVYTLYDTWEGKDTPGRAIVSNNSQGFVDHVVSCPDLAADVSGCEVLGDFFDTAYGIDPTIDDRENLKPDPHYLEQVMADHNTTDILFVGDSEADIRAAENTGVDSAYIPFNRENAEQQAEQLPVDPDYVLESLEDLGTLTRTGSASD